MILRKILNYQYFFGFIGNVSLKRFILFMNESIFFRNGNPFNNYSKKRILCTYNLL